MSSSDELITSIMSFLMTPDGKKTDVPVNLAELFKSSVPPKTQETVIHGMDFVKKLGLINDTEVPDVTDLLSKVLGAAFLSAEWSKPKTAETPKTETPKTSEAPKAAESFSLENLRKLTEENSIKPLSATDTKKIQDLCRKAAMMGKREASFKLSDVKLASIKLSFPDFNVLAPTPEVFTISW